MVVSRIGPLGWNFSSRRPALPITLQEASRHSQLQMEKWVVANSIMLQHGMNFQMDASATLRVPPMETKVSGAIKRYLCAPFVVQVFKLS